MLIALSGVLLLLLLMIILLIAMTRPQPGTRRRRCQSCGKRWAIQGALCGPCQSVKLIRYDG